MLKKIFVIFILLVAGICAYAATRPNEFRVERKTTIKAPSIKVYGFIQDLHQWEKWSPWEKIDPDMKRTFSGAAFGKGAKYGWVGNSKVGEGDMEVVDVVPGAKVALRLHFVKPFESSSDVDFTLTSAGSETTVIWTMSGPMNFLSKLMCVFTSMDKMIGPDFEKGLAQLKAAAEK